MKKLIISSLLAFTSLSAAKFELHKQTDVMTGEEFRTCYAEPINTLEVLKFPYENTYGTIIVNQKGLINLFFSKNLILDQRDVERGYNIIRVRVKDSKGVFTLKSYQEWGEKYIQFEDSYRLKQALRNEDNIIFELHVYKEGDVHFNAVTKGFRECEARMKNAK